MGVIVLATWLPLPPNNDYNLLPPPHFKVLILGLEQLEIMGLARHPNEDLGLSSQELYKD